MNIKIKSKLEIQNSTLNANKFAAYMDGGDKPKKASIKPALHQHAPYKFKDPTYPEPIKNTHPDYIAYKKQLDELKAKAQRTPNSPSIPQQIAKISVASPYAQGQNIGTKIANTTGGQIVILGETHDQTAQVDVLVGVVQALKAKGDKRQIIYIDEQPKNNCLNDNYTQWNKIEPSMRKAGTLGETICGAISAKQFTESYNKAATRNPLYFRNTTAAKTLNELSRLAPSMLAFNIDVNQDSRSLPDIDRDTAMAMNIKKLREQYPDAIIIGNFGTHHAAEICQDKLNTPNNLSPEYANLNDPMAEQLALLYGHDKVHTIRVAPIGSHLNYNCNYQKVYKNTGQFDYVITVKSQNPKTPWTGGEWEKKR